MLTVALKSSWKENRNQATAVMSNPIFSGKYDLASVKVNQHPFRKQLASHRYIIFVVCTPKRPTFLFQKSVQLISKWETRKQLVLNAEV